MKKNPPQGWARQKQRLLTGLDRVRQNIEILRPLHEHEPGPIGDGINSIIKVIMRLYDRIEWELAAPVVIAVLGATGTGKSKIFNTSDR